MLKRSFEKLEFVLQNLFVSTKAVGLSIIDTDGNLAAECGRLDMELFSENAVRLFLNSSNMLSDFTGSSKEVFTWLEGDKGKMLMAKISDKFLLLVFYSRDIDIFSIKTSINSFVRDINSVFMDIKPHVQG
jgi:predicted regulator of Ras-like GTPase activity (Roadblock/LC7/MglB family)